MDTENLKSWASQPDACRCCLSTSGTCDMTASYITEAGIKEVYSDMLQECYGITLSCMSDWGPSRLVCELCVGHLRDAYRFRKQVLRAEKHFTDYCSEIKDFGDPVTVKSETDREIHSDGYHVDSEIVSNYDNKTKPEKNARKRRKLIKVKRRQDITDEECDSDTPIARLSKKNVSSAEENTVHDRAEIVETIGSKEDSINFDGFKSDVAVKGQHHTMRKNCVKQVSERKRIMVTCEIVLRDTTACPFRHHKSWFQCFFCSQDFMELNVLREHTLQTHSDVEAELKKIKRYPRSLQIEISNLKCRQCGLILTDVSTLRRHLGEVHSKVIYSECIADYKVNVSPYTCHICGLVFHVFRTLTTHLNEHYANCICDVCGKSFLNSKRLKVHKRTHDDGHYPCKECGKVLKTKISKANHIESAHSKRIIKCQICFKPMKHYNDRIKHMSEVHNITHKFKCPICSREYNIKHYLATHIRQTHGHKNKKCSECGMAFITNHGLKKHMLKHTGQKPFTCNVCCKSYARSYTLREHMRAHDNDRRFLCNE